MTPAPFHQQCLRSELARRCSANARYSLRAFAKSLRLDAGTLSRLLSGRQVPSAKMAERLLAQLELSPEERKRFLATTGSGREQKIVRRVRASRARAGAVIEPAEMSLEVYRAISDWYHAAILELTFVKGFKPEARWIASKLDISPTEAQLAMDRLTGLGLLRAKDGKLTKADQQLTTADKNVTTPAHRRNQRQLLEKAIHSLENDPIEERDMTSMVMAIDHRLIPEARRRIQDFHRELCELLESGSRDTVYNLEVCLYPLQKREKP